MLDIDYLIRTARDVGEVHRKYHRRVDRRQKDVPKGVDADICDVDEIADSIIRSRFNKKRQAINIFSEESGLIDNGSEYTLYADSLDGTSFYLMGKRYSCVSLGLTKGDELIMGVVYNGLTDQLYAAEEGSGAYVCDAGKHRTLKTKSTSEIKDSVLAIPSVKEFFYDERNVELFRKLVMDTWRFDCEGSIALNLCDIADGIFDLMVCDKIGGPWDFAGGLIILKEAGGHYADWNKKPFNVQKPGKIIAASNERLYNGLWKKYAGGWENG